MPRITKNISSRSLPAHFIDLVRLHPPAAIHDEIGYDNALDMINLLTSLPKLSAGQSQYLDTLSILIEAYEAENHAIEDVSALEALKHLLGEHEMSASDLGRLLGDRSLGPKILGGSRELSKDHIRKLADHFGVSAAVFI